ncbi:nicotinamide riboside transporter PnuC [Alteromonas oceanisediminis]|uniref:nicotinamide riboside transporter PnuC n=1 Tax=Alteromonas oceanisediminis TaxID=2836180 RepID=UPI001BDB3F15|nr:nicotinamide riboside transporter PnuC [Alteromonas oceanisediminis]MBT0584846.1 nicotinamide riboside transporter PnuC [Alteromonas oceanisediminis]
MLESEVVHSVSEQLVAQASSMHAMEVAAVVLALGYVILAARQSILCWVCAFISTLLYVGLFWQVSLPYQTVLNGYYVVMAVYGFWQWRHSGAAILPISTFTATQHAGIAVSIGIVTLLLALLTKLFVSTPFVYTDAFVTVASVITTVLVAHKKLENWLYWIVINLVACWLYWQVELWLTSMLFGVYTLLALYGYREWRIQWLAQREAQV